MFLLAEHMPPYTVCYGNDLISSAVESSPRQARQDFLQGPARGRWGPGEFQNLRKRLLMTAGLLWVKKKPIDLRPILGWSQEIDGFKRYSLERDSSHGWPSKNRGGFPPKSSI